MNLDPTASDAVVRAVTVTVTTEAPAGAVVGIGGTSDGDVPDGVGGGRVEVHGDSLDGNGRGQGDSGHTSGMTRRATPNQPIMVTSPSFQ